MPVTLTKPEQNLLAKLSTEYGVNTNAEGPNVIVRNQINGVPSEVSPLVAALVAFVYESNRGGPFDSLSYRGKKVAVSIFDRTRYLVLKIDPNAYSNLLD